MKSKRLITFKRITRVAYVLGLVFLLSGMLLSLVSQPAAASFNAKPTPPRNVNPPGQRTPEAPQPTTRPQVPNPDEPGNPVNPAPAIQNRNFNFNTQPLPGQLRPPARIQVAASGTVRFTQSNYCFPQAEAGTVPATVEIELPPGEIGYVSIYWRVVHPDNLSADLYTDHYEVSFREVKDGDRVTIEGAYWPGANLWQPGGIVEIHWGATLRNSSGAVLSTAGLDAYYNGRCDQRRALEITNACVVGGGIQWNLTNPNFDAVPYTLRVDGAASGSGSVAGYSTISLVTTSGGAHTVSVSYDNGLGQTETISGSSTAGQCAAVPALSVSHACSADGIAWTASNPGSSSVTINYTIDGTTTGSTTVPAGGSVVFATTSAGAHTVSITWDDGVGGTGRASGSSTAGECAQQGLTIAFACIEGGGIQWSVFNPNLNSVAYTWTLDTNQGSGSGTVGAGQSQNVTTSSGGAHTLDVTWTGGSASRSSTITDCGGPTRGPLVIVRACVTGGIQWSVRNDGQVTLDFNWDLDSGARAGNGSVGAGQTVNVVTSTGGAHLLTVTWDGNSTSERSSIEDCGGAPTSLTVTFACTEGGIQWRVNNPNNFDLAFNWNLDNGAGTGTGTAPANGSTNVTVSTGGAHTLSITWDGGSTSTTSDAESCSPRPLSLNLSFACTETGTQWTASNPNNQAVAFNWSRDNNAETGQGSVPANGTSMFLTTGAGVHTVTITWDDGVGGTGSASATAEDTCTPEELPNLTVTYRCVATDRIQWTVRNPGDVNVAFEWDLDNGAQTGSDSVAANSNKAFVVTGNGRHTIKISWPSGAPEREFSRTSSRSACQVETTTPTTIITTPSVTVTPGITGTPGTPQPTVQGTPGIPNTGATPINTLAAPGGDNSANAGTAINPVTGVDLASLPLTSAALWQSILLNLGLLCMGIGLVFHGLSNRRK